MPHLPTAQVWLSQSSLLLAARPKSTRITAKYTLSSKRKSKSKPVPHLESSTGEGAAGDAGATATRLPKRATLTLKTYDPESGTTLKYVTDKAAEVGRLVAGLGRLGRGMAGLPELKEDIVMSTVDRKDGEGVATPVGEKVAGGAQGAGAAQSGKKKKKGKK